MGVLFLFMCTVQFIFPSLFLELLTPWGMANGVLMVMKIIFDFLIYRRSLEEDERKESQVESKLLEIPNVDEKHHSESENAGFKNHKINNKEENGTVSNNSSNV